MTDRSLVFSNELLVGFVGSPLAHARIVSVDVAHARKVKGIAAVLTPADVPGENRFETVLLEGELLAAQECRYIGQPLIAIAAESIDALSAAMTAVRLKLEPLPAVLTMDDAIVAHDLGGPKRQVARGDPRAALARAEHVLEGRFRAAGHDDPDWEAPVALAVPAAEGPITIHAQARDPDHLRHSVARCLGVPANQVVCFSTPTKGGLGGKEPQATHAALLAALVAFRTGRPACIVYPRSLDLGVTGQRHCHLAAYKVGFASDGRIDAMTLDLYSDRGCSADMSFDLLMPSLLNADNAYYVPHFGISWTVCRTNLPLSLSLRGMGAPQAVAAIENILEEIAGYLGLDPLDVRRKNCDRGPGRDVTQQGQSVFNDTLSVILDRLAETAGYARRREEAVRFNAGSRTHVRGLTLMPVRCGVPRGRRTRHQGSAWVDIDRDGTIQVSIGGPDMGHEFRTMFRHLVADQFAVPIEMVRLTLTAVVHYNSAPPSSALAGIDVDGTAALRACEAVKDRLTELAAKHLAAPADGIPPSPGHVRFENAGVIDVRRPGQRLGFLELVQLAHAARVDLGARGFYATSAIDLGRETASIYPYASVTSGAALSEAEIDRASGQLSVKQVDILIDIGRSLSPAVDRDQVIGGFLHGMRWATTSKHLDSRAGELPSAAASNDETPRAESLPGKTHVDFLEQPQNGMSLESSRSMGESPFLLGISVWAAAKQALTSLSQGRHSALDLPATTEEILRCLAPVIPPEPPAPGEVRGQCDG